MTVSYRYNVACKRIETRCEGEVTVVEVMNHFHLLSLDAEIAAAADVLLDFTAMVSVPEDAHLATIADQIQRLTSQRPFGRCALVAPQDRGLEAARLFEQFAGSQFTGFRIFFSRGDAVAWLTH